MSNQLMRNIERLLQHGANRYYHYVGYLLVLLSLGYIIHELYQTDLQKYDLYFSDGIFFSLVAACLLYTIALTFTGLGWQILNQKIERKIFAAHAFSLIGKYLPGNIFHFVGRHALMVRHGYSHKALIVASAGEIIGLCCTALLFSAMLYHAGTIFILLPCCILAYRILFPKQWLIPIIYAGFFVFTGLSGTVILFSGMDIPIDMSQITAICALAWFAGFIIPGAPGGLGIREAVTVIVLKQAIGLEEAIAFSVLMRLITTIGDVILWGIAYGVMKRQTP